MVYYLLTIETITSMVKENQNPPVKIDTGIVKPSLCDYADAYILVTGNITVEGGDGNKKVAFKNCHHLLNQRFI